VPRRCAFAAGRVGARCASGRRGAARWLGAPLGLPEGRVRAPARSAPSCLPVAQNDPNPLSDPAGSIKHYEDVRAPLPPPPLDRRRDAVNATAAITLHCREYYRWNPAVMTLILRERSRCIAANITVAM
jgi:hypothetical protein